jgi:hypothetical protein
VVAEAGGGVGATASPSGGLMGRWWRRPMLELCVVGVVPSPMVGGGTAGW